MANHRRKTGEASNVKDFVLKLAGGLITAAILFTAAQLWKMNERLTRIEYKLGITVSKL